MHNIIRTFPGPFKLVIIVCVTTTAAGNVPALKETSTTITTAGSTAVSINEFLHFTRHKAGGGDLRIKGTVILGAEQSLLFLLQCNQIDRP